MHKDKHVIEALGKARIIIENGEVTYIGEPQIDYCPIFGKYHNIQHITREDVKKNIEYRINDFGMCRADRQLKMNDMLSVGISEILRSNVELGNIDCVVGACEGAGTVLITDPDTVQGVGGRVSGLVETAPIPEVIEKLGEDNVLNKNNATLDQLEGLKMAVKKGYINIAVTILPCDMVKKIRKYALSQNVNVYILVAHTTGTRMEDVAMLFENADIVTACASKNIIEYAQKAKPYYYGTSVPIYAVSENGRMLLDSRLKKIGKKASTNTYPQDLSKMARELK